MNTTNITAEKSLTIREALALLGDQAPSRQSFHAAVTNGKIQKAIDHPDAADGKIRVLSDSLLAHVAAGGFKTCGKAGREAISAAGTQVEGQVTSPSTSVGNHRLDSHGGPDNEECKSVAVAVNVGTQPKGKSNKDSNLPLVPTTKAKPRGKKHPKPVPTRAAPNANVKKADSTDAKGRRTPHLRVLKNSLRHLNFEQTKAIRDWADNRLLTVLLPVAAAPSTSTQPEDGQPA